jgi:ankyrin repeat protein
MTGNKVNYERHPNPNIIWPLLREVNGPTVARARFPQWKINGPAYISNPKPSYFLFACRKGDLQVAKVLFEMGANVTAKNKFDESALLCACGNHGKSAVALVTWLLEQKEIYVNIDDRNISGSNALFKAVTSNNPAVVHTLLCYGIDRTLVDNNANTVADYARRGGWGAMAQLIDDWKVPEIEEWRPWNAKLAPVRFRVAIRSLLVLAKASSEGLIE